MSISLEKITEKYGDDSIELAELFAIDKKISNIFYFESFALIFAKSLLKSYQFERYEKFVNLINEDYKTSFLHQQEVISKITFGNLVSFFSLKVVPLKNLFKEYFATDKTGRTKFNSEHDLEMVIHEYFHWFDLQETIQIKRQHLGVDLLITNGNNKYAVELKKGRSKRKDIYQSLDYSKTIEHSSPILIAYEFENDHLQLASELGVACYTYDAFYQLPYTNVFIESVGDFKNNDFESLIDYMVTETCHISGHIPRSGMEETIVDCYKRTLKIANQKIEAYNDYVSKLIAN